MDQELIRAARRTDLAAFLLQNHPDQVRRVGNSLCFRDHDSLVVKLGYCGYKRFSNKEHGNSIDCLMKYLGYSFQEAVEALTRGSTARVIPADDPVQPARPMNLPVQAEPPFKRVFAYLTIRRGIPAEVVRQLMRFGLLYQEQGTGNAVFVNADRTFCELRGTNTLSGASFHGIRRTAPDCCWSYCSQPGETVRTAYICEGAIDAVSLMVLHQRQGNMEPAHYIGMGGVANQKIIDLAAAAFHAVLAVDNDTAGQQCRERNASLEAIIPVRKDWNEDLLAWI